MHEEIKPLGAKQRTNNKFISHMASTLGFESDCLQSNDVYLDIIYLSKFGSNSCYIHFDALQCIFKGFNCGTLLPIQEKGNGIASYLVSELW